MNKEHYRTVIFFFFNFRRDLNRKACFEEINQGLSTCFFAIVKRWYNKFEDGRLFLNATFRTPKPKNSVTEKRVLIVKNIQATVKIGVEAIHTILHKHFSL